MQIFLYNKTSKATVFPFMTLAVSLVVTADTGKASSFDDIQRKTYEQAQLVKNLTGGLPPPPGGIPPALLTPNFPPPGESIVLHHGGAS